ncbi:MAG: phosphate signaling complex protein PhoU [Planctomycetota bacterium]
MSIYFQRDVQKIHRRMMSVFGIVEKMIDDAATALVERRVDLAEEVLAQDKIINATEVEIEEECLKMLALHQPVAGDLRRLTTVLKINGELERMADLACNICERAISLHQHPLFPIPDQLPIMVQEATLMVRMALDSFVDSDVDLAKNVIECDASVDQHNGEIIEKLTTLMCDDSSIVEPALHCFSASRHVERIADLAENIAEDVIYLVDGAIVRHKHGEFNIHKNKT